jgi:hypothetical protein
MALCFNTGPNVTTGNLDTSQVHDADIGPNVDYQGSGLLDPRFVGSVGAAPGSKVYAVYTNPFIAMVDAIPQAIGVGRIAAAQNITNATAMTLVSAQGAGVSPNMPVVPLGSQVSSANVVKALVLDFGFSTGNTTATSASVTIPAGASKFYTPGQKIAISGAGASANNPLLTSVVSVSGTTLVVKDVAGQTVSNAQIGTLDLTGTQIWPYIYAGGVACYDPTQGLARCVSITGAASNAGSTFTVKGYDIYNQPMTEAITVGAGVTTAVNGKKAWKSIVSVTPNSTDAHNYSVDTTDIFGLAVRSDFWEYMNVYYNGAFVSVSTGWTVVDTTTPATTTTGDVRGTYAVQSASNGTKRLAAFTSLPIYNAIGANNLNTVTLFGVTNV